MIYSIIDFFLAILNTIVIRMQGPAWYKGQSTSIFFLLDCLSIRRENYKMNTPLFSIATDICRFCLLK